MTAAPCGPGGRAPGAERAIDPVEAVPVPIEENLPPEVVLVAVDALRARALGAVIPERGDGRPSRPC